MDGRSNCWVSENEQIVTTSDVFGGGAAELWSEEHGLNEEISTMSENWYETPDSLIGEGGLGTIEGRSTLLDHWANKLDIGVGEFVADIDPFIARLDLNGLEIRWMFVIFGLVTIGLKIEGAPASRPFGPGPEVR